MWVEENPFEMREEFPTAHVSPLAAPLHAEIMQVTDYTIFTDSY
jgi:hypothetical protein